MTITAFLLEIEKDGETRPMGDYEFVAVPSVGDIIPDTSLGNVPYLLKVVAVRHSPVAVDSKLNDADVPKVFVYVELSGLET